MKASGWEGRKTLESQVLTSSYSGNGNIGFTVWGQVDTQNQGPSPDNNQGGGDGLLDVIYEYYPDTGRLFHLTDDNRNQTEWVYDVHGAKTSEKKGATVTPPSGHNVADRDDTDTTIQWAYNSNGTVQTMTKEDGTVLTYVYNLANKYLVTTINVTDAPSGVVGTTQQTFAYDGAGRVVQSTDNNGTCEVTVELSVTTKEVCESLGRLLEERQWIGSYSGVSNSATPVFDHPYAFSGQRFDSPPSN